MTNSTIEIRTAYMAALTAVHPKVYYEDAPANAEPPYLVFNLPTSRSSEKTEIYMMDLDAWDKDQSTIVLENLIFSAHEAIHKKVFNSNGISFYAALEGKFSLNDPDVRLKRRKYTYQIRTFGGL